MRAVLPLLLAVVGACLAAARAPEARADGARAEGEHVAVELVAEAPGVVPGQETWLGLRFTTAPGWHVYWRFVGDSGEPPAVRWSLPPGFEAGPFQWPAPRRFVHGPVAGFGYTGEVLLPVRLTVPRGVTGPSVRVSAEVTWLVCDEECVPGEARLALDLPVLARAAPADARHASAFADARARLPAPWPAPASLHATPETGGVVLRIEGEGPWSAGEAAWSWFPTTPLRFAHAADVEARREGSGWRLRLPLAPGRAAPPRLEGVLEVAAGGVGHPFALDLPLGGVGAGGAVRAAPPAAGEGPATLWHALLLAFLGGLILNVMPCVLPVIGVKILGFVQQAGEDPRRVRRHGYAFGAGVVVSFWGLAGLLLVLREAGEGLGWGFQFQDPRFTGGLCLLMLLVGLQLLGTFELGHRLAGRAGEAAVAAHGGYAGSFWNGVLATVVATPCTAPFMGPALAYALAVPAVAALLVFTSLGVGMAAPYVVLSLVPRWLAWLPRPGPWMETLKQLMAFPMLAVVVGVGHVFGRQTGVGGLTWLYGGLLAAGFAAWLYGRFGGPLAGPLARAIAGRGLPLLLLAVAVLAVLTGAARTPEAEAAAPPGWERWRPGIEAERRAQGRPVFVDYTADWCLTCKANDVAVLSTDTVREAARRHDVALVWADWTRRSDDIRDALRALGRASVPVYVVYPADPDRPPILLPTVVTPGQLAEAFADAAASGS